MKNFYYILFFLCVALTSLTTFGVESFQHINLVSPKLIKNHKSSKKVSIQDQVPPRKEIIPPAIHLGIWPCFCSKHLVEDPAGCSSWSEDESGKMQLDFFLDGTAEAYFDPELIQSISLQINLIPKSTLKLCNYAWCSKCKQTVLRGVSYYDDDDDYEEEDPQDSLVFFPVHKCACTGNWWLDLDSEDETSDICEGWNFCGEPTIYAGYVDLHHKVYFHFLKRYLSYIEENRTCDCYWPQVEVQAKNICNSIYVCLLNELKTSN